MIAADEGGTDLFWRCYGEYRGNPKHFLKYLTARYHQYSDAVIFRHYIAEVSRATAEGVGANITRRYAELLKPQKVDTRTPEQIIDHISEKLARMEG